MEFEPVIGLEIHIQCRTQSKMFCTCRNTSGEEPNTNTCPICTAQPGVMPRINAEAVHQMIVAGLMTDCTIAEHSKFDRKSYYYPDMPKNYQITQYDLPICLDGRIPIGGKGLSEQPITPRYIGLERIHLEEDVGKSTHYKGFSHVDYNRAGIPLMETVSRPDMRSADEAYAYVLSLQQIMRYGGVSDCDQEKGQFRCDVNISVRPKGREQFGTKIEIKNLNSTRHIWLSINHEIERQSAIYRAGGTIRQETRRWDDAAQETVFMRTKETADDYRYFPEPDLPPLYLPKEQVDKVRATLPLTPQKIREKMTSEYGVSDYDAHVLTLEKETCDYFLAAATVAPTAGKGIANIMMNLMFRDLAAAGQTLAECKVKPAQLGQMVKLMEDGVISSKIGQTVFAEMMISGKDPKVIVEEKGLVQVSDTGAISEFARQAIAANPKAVAEYKEGKGAAVQFLVGQVMKMSKGKANPGMLQQILKDELDKL